MGSQVTPAVLTAEEFLARCADQRSELVRGEVVEMAPAGGEHGDIHGEIFFALRTWNQSQRRGKVTPADVGFILARDPDTVRQADTAFISSERYTGRGPTGFYELAPDLVLEVVSPTDRRRHVMAKVDEWLAAGTQVVWVVWPTNQTVWVCRKDRERVVLGLANTLTCDDLLPGFALPVRDLFETDV